MALSEETLERSADIRDKTLLLEDYETNGHTSKELRRHKKDVYQRYRNLQGWVHENCNQNEMFQNLIESSFKDIIYIKTLMELQKHSVLLKLVSF